MDQMDGDERDRRPRITRPGEGFPRRLGERLCLDFVNTTEPRFGPDIEDFLIGFGDLVRWGDFAGAISAAETRALLHAGERDPAAARSVFRRAIDLREALYRLFGAIATSEEPAVDDRDLLFDEYRAALGQSTIAAREGAYAIDWREGDPSLDRVVAIVARSAVELLTEGEPDRIRQCHGGNEDCGWLFYDISKNGRRRWCSMEGCGSRAKMRQYRARQRGDARA